MKIKDYAVILKDSTGKTCSVSVHADCIAEQIRAGASEGEAIGNVEDNNIANAIWNGEIGADCWVDGIEE